jgi:glycosyltransferase involved in cell wall biosynthesis
MNRPKVSVSVPVYNAEKYLHQCLDSLINQTLQDIEIVIVNDGSTDGSEAICREYANKDSRIKLISKANGGSASARQAALEASTGQFFCACDADDWVEPTMYEKLYNRAQEVGADIVFGDYWMEYGGGKQTECHFSYDITKIDDFLGAALDGVFPCQVWDKMFNRKLFDKYAITWEPGINLGEDFLIMLKILLHPVKVAYVSDALYHYRREWGGASYTNNISFNTFQQSLYTRKFMMKSVDTNKYASGVFRLWVNLAFTGLRVKDGVDPKYYKKEVMSNLPIKGFFEYHYPTAKGILILFTKVMGYKCGRIIYKLLYRYAYR